jgi:hypothetical protein
MNFRLERLVAPALFAQAALLGCAAEATYSPLDQQGPLTEFAGMWIDSGGGTLAIKQHGGGVTCSTADGKTWRGTVNGRVLVSENRAVAMTASPDGKSADMNWAWPASGARGTDRLYRAIVGPSSEHDRTKHDALQSGGLICQLPSSYFSLAVPGQTPPPVRQYLVMLEFAPDERGAIQPRRVAISFPIGPPGALNINSRIGVMVTNISGDQASAMILPVQGTEGLFQMVGFEDLRQARMHSPFYASREGTLDGKRCWWVTVPRWGTGDGLHPTELSAELYWSNPYSRGAVPSDIVTGIAVRQPGKEWQSKATYLPRTDKFIRVGTEPGTDPPQVEVAEDPEPALEPFLVSKETAIAEARWRTRALLAVKNRSLRKICDQGSTSDLKSLVEKLEGHILDVSHEGELAKDKVQKELEAGRAADMWREMVIVYKERIEILKPVLGAIKEEVANRGK